MRYSDAFESLHRMSKNTDIMTSAKLNRVAFFLARIKISEQPWNSLKNAEQYRKCKNDALLLLTKITDNEWKILQELMEEHARWGTMANKLQAMRIDWVRALDTFREFS